MTDHQHASHMLIDGPHAGEDLSGCRPVQTGLDLDPVLKSQRRRYRRERLAGASRRRAQDDFGSDGRPREVVRQALGGSTPPR